MSCEFTSRYHELKSSMYNEIRPFYFAKKKIFFLLTSRIECDTLFLSINIHTVKLLYSLMLLYYQETWYFTILRYPEFTFISLLRKSTTLVYIKLGSQTTLKFTFQCSHFIFMSLLVCLSLWNFFPAVLVFLPSTFHQIFSFSKWRSPLFLFEN